MFRSLLLLCLFCTSLTSPSFAQDVSVKKWILYHRTAGQTPLKTCTFQFHQHGDDLWDGYLVTKVKKFEGTHLVFVFKIEGDSDVQFDSHSDEFAGPAIPQLRAFICGKDIYGEDRWWYPTGFELKVGTWLYDVSLEGWQNVGSKTDFRSNVEMVGVTFGGYFYGHGVQAIGKAKFTMLKVFTY